MTEKNTYSYTEKTFQKTPNTAMFSFATIGLLVLLSLLLVTGCGDYYVNVDKEAVKIEADVEGLINGND